MSGCVGVCGTFRSIFQPGSAAVGPLSGDEAWRLCAPEVERELARPAPNLLRVERIIRKACEEQATNAEGLLAHALSTDSLKILWQSQKKWVDAGFDERLVETDPDSVAYIVETDLLYTLAMFRDAQALDGERSVVRFVNDKVEFKVERQWVSLRDLKGRIPYSKLEQRFIGWNCTHPDGFVRYDDTTYETLYPIAKIRPEVHRNIVRQGQKFWDGREDYDEGKEKPFVLQVITTGRPCFPDSWALWNAEEHTPEHSSARLIGPDGSVYSFGTKMRPADAERVTKISNILSTAESRVPTPDYEETRRSHEKRVTSIALTKERFESICRYVEASTKGFPFNFANANCAWFVTTLMALGGVEVDVRMTSSEFVSGCLPSLRDVPLIGKPLANVASSVALVAVPIIDLIGAFLRYIVPRCIQKVCAFVTNGVSQLFRIVGAFVTNLIALALLGAGRTYIPEETRYQQNRGADGPLALPTATCLMGWKDLFNPNALVFNHALKLKQWQLTQRGCTTIFTETQTGLSCIDPAVGRVVW